jgi:hypothetical protein
MSSSSIDQDKELAEVFTDVVHLRDAFKDVVAAPTLTKQLLVIHGVGGVGKSSLLRMFRLHCKSANAPVALASGDDAKSVLDVLVRWTDDLKADGVAFPAFTKTHEHYRALQAKVETEAGKIAGQAVKGAAKTVIETAASTVPGVGSLLGKLGGTSVEALGDILLSRGFKKPDINLLLDPTKKLTNDFLADMAKAADKRRIVLMLDTFEQMTALEDWTREVAQRLPSNVLFVIAGRALPNWSRAWDSWQKDAYVEELKPMTEEVMRELIQRYYATMRGGEPDLKQVEAIIRFARGLPMVVTSAVQLWVKYGVEDFQSVKAEIVANLVDRLMEGVPKDLIPALEAAAIVRWFDQPILRAVTGLADVREVYNELRRFPFVRVRVEGLALHDAVREIMDENLRSQDSERHCELHERAATYFEKRLEKIGEEVERLGLERLYHRICADEEAGIKSFQEMAEELTRYRLVNYLRALLNDGNTYPLEHENSRLWKEYYGARLAHLESRSSEAEMIYLAIGENAHAESRLRAYALCDLGQIWSKFERLSTVGGVEKARDVLERSQKLVFPIDSKVVFSYFYLRNIHDFKAEWDKAVELLERQRQFFSEKNDYYGLVWTLGLLKHAYALIGDWKKVTDNLVQGYQILKLLPENRFLKVRLTGYTVWAFTFSGRYVEAVNGAGEGLDFYKEVEEEDFIGFAQDLGLALGLQTRYREAQECFAASAKHYDQLGRQFEHGRGIQLGLMGRVLTKQGILKNALECLSLSLQIKNRLQDNIGMPEILGWLAEVQELLTEYSSAELNFQSALDFRWTGRRYFECAALTGLVRVKYAQGDYAAISPLLAEAEQLAREYEYNDHLASLRLTQGHIAWEGSAPTWENGFEAALRFYQHAFIYALRYNRFLLDEVLSGRPQGSPLRPIIPHCLERGEEGRKMLIELCDWWQAGINDIGTPRPDTISPIPEGIPLLEAERIARERELGDGSPQKSVIEQIEAGIV